MERFMERPCMVRGIIGKNVSEKKSFQSAQTHPLEGLNRTAVDAHRFRVRADQEKSPTMRRFIDDANLLSLANGAASSGDVSARNQKHPGADSRASKSIDASDSTVP
jgi:hypothetical protein